MNAFDLRIGNFVIINGLKVSVLEIYNDVLKTSDHRTRCGYFINYFEPIELNEEIFCSIPYCDKLWICDSYKYFSILINGREYEFDVIKYPYLHNLQNIFYAITGEELPINL